MKIEMKSEAICIGVLIALFLMTGICMAGEVFEGKDGIVVMEAESTSSAKGRWKKKTDIEGFKGECHLEFTGNKPMNGSPKSPLKYTFSVDKDGVYGLFIRAHKRLDGESSDRCNDCYVKLKGKFEEGGGAPMEWLKKNVKLFGGSEKGWGWTQQLDYNHKKAKPLYKLKAGEKYTLYVSGRSQRFNMDRIIFSHESINERKAKDSNLEESKKVNK